MQTYKIKKPVFPFGKTGTANAVIPLCFTLPSQKEPRKVPTHLRNITVATGKAYTITLQPTAHRRNSPNQGLLFHTDQQLSEVTEFRLLISAQTPLFMLLSIL